MTAPRTRTHTLRRWALRLLLTLTALLLALLLGAYGLLRASRPQLDGAISLPGLQAELRLQRDALGTATLQGQTRLDLARGLGWLHAQERFFEMDLTRRSAAGELSALFGPRAVERDKERRQHRLRARLSARYASLPAADQALLQAYADGVNAGLHSLAVRPWQYLLLQAQAEDWQPVDSLLVMGEMFWKLQAQAFETGLQRALLRRELGDALFDALHPRGGRWDAPLDGSALTPPALPGRELINLRKQAAAVTTLGSAAGREEAPVYGSNNWAVAGSRSADGAALLADDMHLGLGVPSIWYRTQFELSAPGQPALRAAGLSLPGAPTLVVGSNGAVAWGFTNAYGQWFDWLALDEGGALDAAALQTHEEKIAIKGGASVSLLVSEYRGAPVFKRAGKRYALRWAAHEGEAYNLLLDQMLQQRSAADALRLLQSAGLPHQNALVADSQGHIGWTLAGRLWTQPGIANSRWRLQAHDAPAHQWLAPADYPQRLDPADGQLWTANNRQLGGAEAELIGDGGFDLGARAQQIRDRLAETQKHDEASLARLHLDDEARFIKSWAVRLRRVASSSPAHAEALAVLQGWNGRADADQAGYRLVRATRLRTLDLLWAAWTRRPGTEAPDTSSASKEEALSWSARFEYPAAAALDQQAAHLLPTSYSSWDALLLDQMDGAIRELTHEGKRPLAQAVWAEHNRSRIQHVLSKALPPLARWLDMPAQAQSGDSHLPHVAQAAFGQSQRLVVAPGHEERGSLSMAGGQSGHPLSPHYGAGHAQWAAGERTPLLAGPAEHQLSATPR
ncbi:penicillin acylase family protein [Paucibacter sp. APW11]|uniref:Penicillin acylase family protein n=1 Tax=Roseateles aquae TaxID=3077235 RepID=A0ABU3P7Y3_9BURK|nr:penicillin acylase family protein [Paucibacter sp. APW11]MDT8998679.1 penicillin acylase family protein [Paucibacter sp. APW11]